MLIFFSQPKIPGIHYSYGTLYIKNGCYLVLFITKLYTIKILLQRKNQIWFENIFTL